MTESERNALVEKYLPLVQKIAASIVSRNKPGCVELDDVIQDASTHLLKNLSQFEGRNGSSMSTYLHTVIRRAVSDSIRKQMPRDRYGFYFEPISAEPRTPSALDRRILKEHLTTKQVQAVELVYVYGFTQEIAAEKMATTRRAVMSLLRKSIRNLRKVNPSR